MVREGLGVADGVGLGMTEGEGLGMAEGEGLGVADGGGWVWLTEGVGCTDKVGLGTLIRPEMNWERISSRSDCSLPPCMLCARQAPLAPWPILNSAPYTLNSFCPE